MSSLGYCPRCSGHLHMVGDVPMCGRCGAPDGPPLDGQIVTVGEGGPAAAAVVEPVQTPAPAAEPRRGKKAG